MRQSYCVAFTPKLYKLALPSLHINHLLISNTDSIKYLGYIFTSDNSDDAEMLKQMRLLYCRSNRLIRMCIVKYLVPSDEAVPAKCLC